MLLIVFFYGKGVVHHESVSRGQTVNGEFYCCTTTMHLLTRRSSSVNFWRSTRRLSSPNSPTLQIWPLQTFFLFPKLKSTLKSRRFQTTEEPEENSLWDLRAIPQNAFQNWKKRWKRCTDSRGEYFEGDKSYLVVNFSINVLKRKFGFFLDRPCTS
jgi:hypothetical protein